VLNATKAEDIVGGSGHLQEHPAATQLASRAIQSHNRFSTLLATESRNSAHARIRASESAVARISTVRAPSSTIRATSSTVSSGKAWLPIASAAIIRTVPAIIRTVPAADSHCIKQARIVWLTAAVFQPKRAAHSEPNSWNARLKH